MVCAVSCCSCEKLRRRGEDLLNAYAVVAVRIGTSPKRKRGGGVGQDSKCVETRNGQKARKRKDDDEKEREEMQLRTKLRLKAKKKRNGKD